MQLIHCNKGYETKWRNLECLSKGVMKGIIVKFGLVLRNLSKSKGSIVLLWFGCYWKERTIP